MPGVSSWQRFLGPPARLALGLVLAVALLGLLAWRSWPAPPPRDGGGDPRALLAVLAAAAQTIPQGVAAPAARGPADPSSPAQAPGEVWDLSAFLADDQRQPLGLRLTVLRVQLSGAIAEGPRASAFAAGQIMLAGLSLLRPGEPPRQGWRAARVALGLAGAGADLWVEDWHLRRAADGGLHLQAQLEDTGIDLLLTPTGDPPYRSISLAALAGEGRGWTGGADLQPRLRVSGRLTLAGQVRALGGVGLLEHGWGDGLALLSGGRGQLAVNRFTLVLDDGSALACVQLRRAAGDGTPIPTCLLADPDGTTRVLRRQALALAPEGRAWQDPGDGGHWPLRWRLAVPEQALELRWQPAPGQTPAAGLLGPLWSGLMQATGQRGSSPVRGDGRMELGGYGANK